MMTGIGSEASVVVGPLRVQALSEHLVRIEEQGPCGFEDRETFSVRDRRLCPVEITTLQGTHETILTTAAWRIVIPDPVDGLNGVRVEHSSGEVLCVLSNATVHDTRFLPSPSAMPAVWVLNDIPRVIPPTSGALSSANRTHPTSGWDLDNRAQDAYVFFPATSGYTPFRRDYLQLTGAIPLVPLYTLGLWYSRYHAYTEEDALAVIARFRTAEIPLDVFVLDTDWRIGASSGYAINTNLFPDMARFIQRAHEKQVRIMLNDHPEPNGTHALDPEELAFRREGLRSLLDLGADLWWFDRNWHTCLHPLAPGLEKEVWGMRLYQDIMKEAHPDRRPLILSNADGINNGRREAPSHPAAHRFPVWWTGDTLGEWSALASGIRNGVNSGIDSLMPYVHEDLGGHHGQPDAELYIRFMQFGAFSPVARIHCGHQVHRYPWAYGPEVEGIVGDAFRLRYRLLPMLYAAAHEAHRTGLPLMRRCDLEWPSHPEAADDTQYLLGDDLLVAPIHAPAVNGEAVERTMWLPPGHWQHAWSGRLQTGPAQINVKAARSEIPLWIRLGGVVLTHPQRQTTGEAIWPTLTVDAFVPLQNQEQVRWLEEDDGISIAAEQGATARTAFCLRREGERISLAIQPQAAAEGLRPAERHLLLRIHLPPGTRAVADTGKWTVLNPQEGHVAQLFPGAGARPPGESGAIMEWSGPVNSATSAEWGLTVKSDPG